MIATAHRLPLRSLPDFFQKSNKWFSPYWTVFWRPHQSSLQVAVIVGTVYSKKATDRNKIKRQLKSLISQSFSTDFPIQMVIAVKKKAAGLPYAELASEMNRYKKFVEQRVK